MEWILFRSESQHKHELHLIPSGLDCVVFEGRRVEIVRHEVLDANKHMIAWGIRDRILQFASICYKQRKPVALIDINGTNQKSDAWKPNFFRSRRCQLEGEGNACCMRQCNFNRRFDMLSCKWGPTNLSITSMWPWVSFAKHSTCTQYVWNWLFALQRLCWKSFASTWHKGAKRWEQLARLSEAVRLLRG